ncbi:MAG TPA: uracil-DNA glycosylase family protein [Ktedonobacterales bacterium]|nr:uracil-DNA glycosylase family protein [Ktedonobacterales bacterium]
MPLWPPLAPTAGFAERERALTLTQSQISACRACEQAGYLACARPLASRRGPAGARVMLIGQAPGRLTIERGIMFGGPSGEALERWLRRAGFAPGALRREVYLSALTRCDPGRSEKGKGDRKPTPAEVALCRPWLERELEQVRPSVILLVGGMAIEAFIGRVKLEEAVGSVATRDGVTLLPLPHPSGVSRWLNDPAHEALLGRALARLAEMRIAWETQDAANQASGRLHAAGGQ